jgi:hypothetical protein
MSYNDVINYFALCQGNPPEALLKLKDPEYVALPLHLCDILAVAVLASSLNQYNE